MGIHNDTSSVLADAGKHLKVEPKPERIWLLRRVAKLAAARAGSAAPREAAGRSTQGWAAERATCNQQRAVQGGHRLQLLSSSECLS